MNEERELKYKIQQLPNNLNSYYDIEQLYFSPNGIEKLLKEEFELKNLENIKVYRIRKITFSNNTKFFLTLKTKGLFSRSEYEKEIDVELFNIISNQLIESKIIKRRYIDIIDNYKFEFDEYFNLSIKLYTVEVELNGSNLSFDSEQIKIENILKNYYNVEFENITYDVKYKNSNLYNYFNK